MLGSLEDRLTAEVNRRLIASGQSVWCVSETDLFASTRFSLEIESTARSGLLQGTARTVSLDEITGVMFRFPRTWWPSLDFDLQDQLFVYHETASSWFCLLSGLACPQINRFGLGWWVHDLSYPDQLRLGMAERLGMATIPAAPVPPHLVRVFPTPATEAEHARHVYVVGDRVLPRTSADHEVAMHLIRRSAALAQWERDTGIVLCRLDFRQQEALELAYVEPMPMLDGEAPDIVDEISEQLARKLS